MKEQRPPVIYDAAIRERRDPRLREHLTAELLRLNRAAERQFTCLPQVILSRELKKYQRGTRTIPETAEAVEKLRDELRMSGREPDECFTEIAAQLRLLAEDADEDAHGPVLTELRRRIEKSLEGRGSTVLPTSTAAEEDAVSGKAAARLFSALNAAKKRRTLLGQYLPGKNRIILYYRAIEAETGINGCGCPRDFLDAVSAVLAHEFYHALCAVSSVGERLNAADEEAAAEWFAFRNASPKEQERKKRSWYRNYWRGWPYAAALLRGESNE